jgi:hypothetical protein
MGTHSMGTRMAPMRCQCVRSLPAFPLGTRPLRATALEDFTEDCRCICMPGGLEGMHTRGNRGVTHTHTHARAQTNAGRAPQPALRSPGPVGRGSAHCDASSVAVTMWLADGALGGKVGDPEPPALR